MLPVWHEFKTAFRSLCKAPGFSLLAIGILAVGLAATIFMFGAIKGYILSPLPFPQSERLMHLERNRLAAGIESMEVTQHEFVTWREQQGSFTDLAGFYTGTVNLSGAGADRPERYDGAFITGNAFGILQANPLLGRTLQEADSRPGAPDVVLLGYSVWQFRYNGDPGIVGRTVRVNSRDAVVIGVMPQGFSFPITQDVWVPLRIDLAQLRHRLDGTTLEVFGRLRAGVTQAQARENMNALAAGLAQLHPETNEGVGAVVQPYAYEYVDRETRATIMTMFAAVSLVLLIACANVANLILVRAIARRREMAVRTALGASRWRITTRILAESLMLSLTASALGLVVADFAGEAMIDSLRAGDANVPFWVDTSTDWQVAAFAIGAGILSSLFAGLIPALRATRMDVNSNLKDGTLGAIGGGAGALSRMLVIAEIALSCVLLVSAGLMLRSLIAMDQRDLGADIRNVLTARIGLFEEQYPSGAEQTAFFDQLVEQLRAEPDVRAVAAATSLPGANESYMGYHLDGKLAAPDTQPPFGYWTAADPGFFDMFDVTVVQGRAYDARDRAETQPVIVVDRLFAERAWPGEDAIGRQVKLGSANEDDEPWRTVIGVVENVHMAEADDPPRESLYVPMTQNPVRFSFVAVRPAGDALAFANRLRDTVLLLNPDMPLYWVRTLEEWVVYGAWTERLVSINFQVFGAIALLLASVGIYAVLAYSVAQRTREIGVRRALGAGNQRIIGTVARQSFTQLAVGLGVGLLLALGFAQLMSSMLIGVDAFDPLTFATVIVVLGGAAVLAATVPTLRALRVNPVQALRYE